MSSDLPDRQSAIVCVSRTPGTNLAIIHDAPLPVPLAPDQVLVRTSAVAVNPCDWKMPDNFPSLGAVDGSDFAGTIVTKGADVSASALGNIALGDRVCGAVHGSDPANHKSGSFATYVAATADIMMKIPPDVSWEDAAAVGGTGISTLGIVFYEHLHLQCSPRKPVPKDETFPVLVYGAGTATGTMAIQLLRACGLRPLAVCSAKSAGLALAYGAERAFDYSSPNCWSQIRDYTNKRLSHVIDIISDELSVEICYQAMGRLGGTYVGLELPPNETARPVRRLVKSSWVMGQTIFGKELKLSGGYERPPIPSHRELGQRWFAEVEELWHQGQLKPHPVRLGTETGLAAVLSGIDLMRRRTVFREKLVYLL